MITKRTIDTIGFAVNYPCKYLLGSGFIWDKANLRCVITRNSSWRWNFGTLVTLAYFIFLVSGILKQLRYFTKENIFEVALHLSFILAYSASLCDKFNYFQAKHSYVQVVNTLIKYFNDFSGKRKIMIFAKFLTTNF